MAGGQIEFSQSEEEILSKISQFFVSWNEAQFKSGLFLSEEISASDFSLPNLKSDINIESLISSSKLAELLQRENTNEMVIKVSIFIQRIVDVLFTYIFKI